MSKITKHRCIVCGRYDIGFPMMLTLCGDCIREMSKRAEIIVLERNVLGGYCENHAKYRWNVSKINTYICHQCMQETVRKGKNYDKERRKYMGKMNKVLT